MKRILPLFSPCLTFLCAAGLIVATMVATLFLSANAASAVQATGHALGYLYAADGRSWIGSHGLADGNVGLCLEVTKSPPEGHDYSYVDGLDSGRFGVDESARVAYIGRHWIAGGTDRKWMAATQLAIWTITGLGSHDQWYYALRANEDRGAVLTAAQNILDEANGSTRASRSVAATLSLSLSPDHPSTVSADLVVDFVNGGLTTLAAGMHDGEFTLTGAHFTDGSTRKVLSNATAEEIVPDSGTALDDVAADVTFSNLPYGDDFSVAQGPSDVQALLVPPRTPTDAIAHARAGEISPLPFRPRVSTQTSTQLADTGTAIYDHLDLTLAEPSPQQSAAPTEAARPTEAVRPTDSAAPTVAAAPSNTAAPTDTVLPIDTVASTDTVAPTDGTAPTDTAAPADGPPATLSEWGVYRADDGSLQPVPVTITSTLYGPFDSPPQESAQAPAGAPIVCTVERRADHGPGRYASPDCTLPAVGYYVWTDAIDPAKTSHEQGGDRVIGWNSHFAEASETSLAQTPPPVTPTTPPTVPPTTPTVTSPPAPPATPATPAAAAPRLGQLAETGRPLAGAEWWLSWPLLAVGLGSTACTLGFTHRRRRLGSRHERVHRSRR